MNLSGFASLQGLRTQSTAQTSIVIVNTQPITELLGQINNLSSAQVDSILIALDGNGLNGGTVNLSGQTPPAPPSATGVVAAASLVVKLWTVTTDTGVYWGPVTEQVTWIDTNGTFTGNLATFRATADLASVSSMVFGGTGNLTYLVGLNYVPALAALDVNTNALTTLDVSGLTSLATLNCSSNASLTALTLTGCTSLTTLDASFCPALTGITGDSTCTSLASISISNSGVTSLTLGGAANMTQIDMTFCPVVSFIANALQTITGDILMDVTSLTTITLPNLTTVGNQLALTSSPFAGTLSLPALVSIGSPVVDLQNNTSLVTLAAPNLVTMSSGIACRASTSLANLSLGSYLPSVGTNIDCFDCALATAAIDMILSRCVASAGWGFGGEFVDLSGGTNLSHALWSAAALADEATLVGRGSPATVVSNP